MSETQPTHTRPQPNTASREGASPSTEVITPRLLRLELHGYKSFANRTEFVFPTGITAIVGPNGSGKSNIADALRWVLGEQSYALLRGKRTEDMIFSGSEQRPRMGMASVSVTFDNRDGWLPVDYGTVALTRRAYRSGENEYFLNGTRVRLRDIQDLLAASGLLKRSYAIIGQGLVDQALSLRPEERRVLIEEAAGITAYQRKRDQALTRLAEVEANLVRVQDIVAEIAPRLKRLRQQVEKVQQHRLLEEELRRLLLTWYGYRWHQAVADLEKARAAREAHEAALAEQRQALQALEQRLQAVEEEQERLRAANEARHRHIAALHREAETLLREEAVIVERQRGLESQRETLLSELPELEAHLRVLEARLADARRQQEALAAEAATLEKEIADVQAELAALEAQRKDAQAAVDAARTRVLRLTARQAQIEEQERQVRGRLDALAREEAQQAERLRRLEARREQARQALAEHRRRLQEAEQALQAVEAALTEREREVQAGQDALLDAQTALRQAQDALSALQERQAVLERWREEGQGFFAGVRAVLRARLPGIVGVVAELLRVPSHLERAVEEALGASLQDIVVERWEDAEAAIAYLKRERAGRATFLPLDTVRAPRRLPAPTGAGVLGLAADLVDADERIRPVVELLLNRTLVVEDLPTARRLLRRAEGLRIVTLEGDLVRTSGRVTGGEGRRRQEGVLAREREWRELPARLAQAEATVREREAALAEARARLNALRDEIRRLRERRQSLRRDLDRLQEEGRRLERALTSHEAQVDAAQAAYRRLEEERRQLQERLTALDAERATCDEERAAAEAALQEAQARLERVDDTDARRRLAHLESQRAGLQGRQRTLEATVRTLEEDLVRQREQIASRRQRLEALTTALQEQEKALAEVRERLADVRQRLAALEQPAQETDAHIRRLDEERQRLVKDLDAARERLHREEHLLAQATLAYQRAQDALERLQQDMQEDLGLIQVEAVSATVPAQAPLPFENGVPTLPHVTELPPGLEAEIKRLRLQLRQLGPINPDAPREYEELAQRHTFLEEQIRDLTEASANLRRVLQELDRAMKREFERTFKAVAREFKAYFQRLFGGGTARLVLTDPQDISATGIDIVARPPRKRTQSLAMLSGGERALTAAALIFAILRVSPPPFCVLDEVDAALDEANVGRFREALRDLARDIQFIVITHNRGTIEVADTIYGISMGPDGVSRALSLRLEEVPLNGQG